MTLFQTIILIVSVVAFIGAVIFIAIENWFNDNFR